MEPGGAGLDEEWAQRQGSMSDEWSLKLKTPGFCFNHSSLIF